MALLGRPNAGKSTLLNQLLQEKVAIVSDSPQTTRHRLVGILNEPRGQIVFYDTPGIHRPLHRLNRQMMQAAQEAWQNADVVCVLHDAASSFGSGDAYLLNLVAGIQTPRILLLNKVDKIRKERLLPLMETFGESGCFEEIVPISALRGDGCKELLDQVWPRLPEGEPLIEADCHTLHTERFLVAEAIRECVLERTREELPYVSAVRIESWREPQEGERALEIDAPILVEKPSQRGILIGRGGRTIRAIGIAARAAVEELLDRPVVLRLHVKVEPSWRENRDLLAELSRDLIAHDPRSDS